MKGGKEVNNQYGACAVLLTTCSNSQKDENILFVTDDTSLEVARVMWSAAKDYKYKSIVTMSDRTMHGQEPTKIVAAAMVSADVIFGITKFSLFHTEARRKAVANGGRFVNMVDYTISMLEKGGLYVDFIAQGKVADKVAEQIVGETIRITTATGTNITAKITGRPAVPQYARSLEKGTSSSPPDIECAVGPLEDTASGVVVIDGSIPHPELGLITDEIKLTLENGKIVDISGGKQAQILAKIMKDFNDPKAYYLGEIGIGLNPMCTLNGRMLEDEGCMGTVHFGFGSNTSFFGIIESRFHLDMVFVAPTVTVDGNIILANGKLPF
jgi:leucyl aminopeptidase (aminopeptidase T)